jgi:hypothetical protein
MQIFVLRVTSKNRKEGIIVAQQIPICRRCHMSLSPSVIGTDVVSHRQKRSQTGLLFLLILGCTALAFVVISIAGLPVTLNAPGAESVVVGP